MAVPLYDYEAQRIQEIVRQVQSKYFGKSNTLENLYALEREIVGRLEDFGFKAFVDITPSFEEKPIEVRVEERIERKDFDVEFKGHEVRKSREKGGI